MQVHTFWQIFSIQYEQISHTFHMPLTCTVSNISHDYVCTYACIYIKKTFTLEHAQIINPLNANPGVTPATGGHIGFFIEIYFS